MRGPGLEPKNERLAFGAAMSCPGLEPKNERPASGAAISGPRPEREVRGFTLVEVLVAVIILSIALSALASLSFQVAQRSLNATSDSYSIGVATNELGYLATLSYDSLPARAGCTTVQDADFPHRMCVTVTDVSSNMREIMLVITPDTPLVSPDTVVIRRSKPTSPNPFS